MQNSGSTENFLQCGGRCPPPLMWGGGGGWGQICLFSICGCLELSDCWTFLESFLSGAMFINFKPLKRTFLMLRLIAAAGFTSRSSGADLGRGCRGCAPPPEMTCGFLIQLVFCKKNYVVFWCWSRARDECTPSWKKSWICPWSLQIMIF